MKTLTKTNKQMKKAMLIIIGVVSILIMQAQNCVPVYNTLFNGAVNQIIDDSINKCILIGGPSIKTDINQISASNKYIAWTPNGDSITPGVVKSKTTGAYSTYLNSYVNYNNSLMYFGNIVKSPVVFNGTVYGINKSNSCTISCDSLIMKWNGTKFISAGIIFSNIKSFAGYSLMNKNALLYVFNGNLYIYNIVANSIFTNCQVTKVDILNEVTPMLSTAIVINSVRAINTVIEYNNELYFACNNPTDNLSCDMFKLDTDNDNITKIYLPGTGSNIVALEVANDTLYVAGSFSGSLIKYYNNVFYTSNILTNGSGDISTLYYSKQFHALIIAGTFTTLGGKSISNLGALQFQLSIPMEATITVYNASCKGLNNGVAGITPSFGTGNYTYNWSNGSTQQSISSLYANTYTVTVSDGNTTIISTATITEPKAIILTTSEVDESGVGKSDGSANVIANGGTPSYFYSWSNGNMTNSISNLIGGTYTVIISDANGCSATSSVIVKTKMTTGINEVSNKSSLVVYPNPTVDGNINIITNGIGKIQVFNLLGSLIQEMNVTNNSISNDPISLNINERGTYLVVYTTSETSISQRVIKQ